MLEEDELEYNRIVIKIYGKFMLICLFGFMIVAYITRTIDLLRMSYGMKKRVSYLLNHRANHLHS